MKKVEHNADIDASPRDIFGFLLRDDFLAKLKTRLDKVSAIELVDESTDADGRIRRITRFSAPADLPRFLKPFKDRAPETVRWDEISIIDLSAQAMRFEIIPEVPDHWHDRYTSTGRLHAKSTGPNRSRLIQQLDYKIDAPALGFMIDRAIGNEVSNIFAARAEVLKSFALR